MGLTYRGRSADAATGANGLRLHGSRSSSSTIRFRLVKSKQVVDKSRAESSVSDKSSTLTSLSEPDVVSTEAAATAIFCGFGAPDAC